MKKKTETLVEQVTRNQNDMRLYLRNWLALALSEAACEAMSEAGVGQGTLRKKTGLSVRSIDEILNTGEFKYVNDLSDILWACGKTLEIKVVPMGKAVGKAPVGEE